MRWFVTSVSRRLKGRASRMDCASSFCCLFIWFSAAFLWELFAWCMVIKDMCTRTSQIRTATWLVVCKYCAFFSLRIFVNTKWWPKINGTTTDPTSFNYGYHLPGLLNLKKTILHVCFHPLSAFVALLPPRALAHVPWRHLKAIPTCKKMEVDTRDAKQFHKTWTSMMFHGFGDDLTLYLDITYTYNSYIVSFRCLRKHNFLIHLS